MASGRVSRRNRSPRFSFCRKILTYQVQPLAWGFVAPGESLTSLKTQLAMRSAPLAKPGVGGYIELRAFYVPMRLMWSSWPDFLMGKTAWAFPTFADFSLSTANAQSFGFTADTSEAFPVAALRQVYSDWFGAEDGAPTPTTTGVPHKRPDRFWLSQAGDDEDDVDATISTAGDNAFTLSEFELAQRQVAQARLDAVVDGDYLKYLQFCGVNASDEAVQRSEPLMRYRRWITPQVAMDGADGSIAERHIAEVKTEVMRRKFFQEHGIVLLTGTFLPKVYADVTSLWEVLGQNEHWPSTIMPAGAGYHTVNPNVGENVQVRTMWALDYGEDQHDRSDTDIVEITPTSLQDVLWPDPTTVRDALYGVSSTNIRCEGVMSMTVATPLSKNQGGPINAAPGF